MKYAKSTHCKSCGLAARVTLARYSCSPYPSLQTAMFLQTAMPPRHLEKRCPKDSFGFSRYRSRSIPSIAQHWDEQSDVAPYPIIRPSCFYDSNRRYTGEEMRQIVELSRSYMQGYRANQGDFDLDEARLLRSTEHVSVLLLNFGDINRGSHYPESSPRRTNTPFFRTILSGIRLISQSFSRPTESSDTESSLTNINAYVSWP